jgi:hypothetical protein
MVDGVPTETPPHVVGAILAFAGTGLGSVVVSRRMIADPRWKDLSSYTMYSGVAVLVLFVAVMFACMIVLAARVRIVATHI